MTPEKIAKEIWAMIEKHEGTAEFDDARHVAQNISTRTGASLIVCEEVAQALEDEMLKAGMLKGE